MYDNMIRIERRVELNENLTLSVFNLVEQGTDC